jgi:hypothetical protein
VLEIPLDDPEEEVRALVEHLHQPDRFLESVIPEVTKEGAARIIQLTPIAFKYDMQGEKCHMHLGAWSGCKSSSTSPTHTVTCARHFGG